jgi:hypothetical protein
MKPIRLLIISSLMVVAFGCSTVSVQYDYDTKADFASLKTFSFMPVTAEANINTLNVKRIQDAVHTQLGFKGYTMIPDNPDFLIAMHLTKKLKKIVIGDGGYSFGSGSYWGSTFSHEYEYEEGTFVLDFVDTQSKELIWRGVAMVEIRDDISPEERIERINEIAQEILNNFPPTKKY